MGRINFFSDYGEANRYKVHEVIGKGSYGLVCSAIDTHTGEWVAIKKINDVFEHVSDAIRILREIKLLRLLRHPDIVQLKHILLPPSPREFKDVYVVFELMESDLHQVIKANDDLTREHFRFFLYQLLRALKYLHTANVFHRDLKPKNVLANSDCKLKICDFGLARVTFTGSSSAIFWTDYVATRWYRAPELCGSFTTKYTTAIDIWSIGCIFAEVLTGRPLFPGRNVAHQLDLITDLLGTPPPEVIAKVRNEKARRYLSSLRKKNPVPFHLKFPRVDPMALRLLQRLLAFDAKDRPTAEEALADPYFRGLAKLDREPTSPPAPKADFEFERQHLTKEDVRELIYREILEYHPQMLKQYMNARDQSRFMYPSAVDQLKRQFDCLQNKSKEPVKTLIERKPTSLPRERVVDSRNEVKKNVKETNNTNNGKKKNNDNKVHNIDTIKANINNSQPLQDKNTTQNREDTTQNRAPLVPYKHSQGESLKNTKVVVCSNLPTKEEAQKDSSYVKKLIKSASMGLSQQVVPTQSQTRSIAPNAKNEQDDKKSAMKSRTRSMGVTVAKMVAAFSNGLAHS